MSQKSFDNYYCEGQLELNDWLQQLEQTQPKEPEEEHNNFGTSKEQLRDYYGIPSTQEIKSSDWDFCLDKLPEEDDVYYTISYLPGGGWLYTYKAFAKDSWWHWSQTKQKWEKIVEAKDNPFAYVTIPMEYRMKDKKLKTLLGLDGIIGE